MPNLNLKGTPAPRPPVPGAKPGAPPAQGKKKILGLPFPIAISVASVLVLGIIGLSLYLFGVFDEEKKQFPQMQFPDSTAQADTLAKPQEPAVELTRAGQNNKPAVISEKSRTTTPDTPTKKAPPPPPPPPRSLSMGMGNYTIQISSWSSQLKASDQVALFNNAGIPAYLERSKSKDGRYRVFVGKYSSKKEARLYAEKIAPTLESGYAVVRVK
ncbi:MAG: SPOR domain-containing protein [Bacteroidetes bacterium]|nr:SPOR domain-containing protein [Bacteroidota bacterium]